MTVGSLRFIGRSDGERGFLAFMRGREAVVDSVRKEIPSCIVKMMSWYTARAALVGSSVYVNPPLIGMTKDLITCFPPF